MEKCICGEESDMEISLRYVKQQIAKVPMCSLCIKLWQNDAKILLYERWKKKYPNGFTNQQIANDYRKMSCKESLSGGK